MSKAPPFLASRLSNRHRWLVLITVGLGSVAAMLSSSIFSVALPALGRHFNLVPSQVQWVMTGFMSAMTVAMLPIAWFLDRFGFRRCFLGAVLVLVITAIVGSLASHFAVLVAVRIVQGAAAGWFVPMGTIMVMRLFPSGQQGKAAGIQSFGTVLIIATAPALGGTILDHFGWQAVFLINLPLSLMAGLAGLYVLPRDEEVEARNFDWFGIVLLGLFTLSMVEGVASLRHSGFLAPWTLSQLGASALTLILFIWHGRRTEAPIVSLDLFRERSFAVGSLVSFTYGFGLYASVYLIPVFLQVALGVSATAAGFALLPSGLTLAFLVSFAGRLADRYPPQLITMAGLAIFGFSFLQLAIAGGHIAYVELVGIMAASRVGLALIGPALTLAMLRHMAPRQLGQSSMLMNYMQQLGGMLGIAIAAVLVEWRESVHGATPGGIAAAFSEGFLMVAAMFLLAFIAAIWMKPQKPHPGIPVPQGDSGCLPGPGQPDSGAGTWERPQTGTDSRKD